VYSFVRHQVVWVDAPYTKGTKKGLKLGGRSFITEVSKIKTLLVKGFPIDTNDVEGEASIMFGVLELKT
jgi:hypothetical protein